MDRRLRPLTATARSLPTVPSLRPRRAIRTLAAIALVTVTAACGSDGPDTIDRQAFIDTYVDLRVAALTSETGTVSDADRTRILQEHGVTEDDLLTFADVHGRDAVFMRDVWDEVERRLDERRPTLDDPTGGE